MARCWYGIRYPSETFLLEPSRRLPWVRAVVHFGLSKSLTRVSQISRRRSPIHVLVVRICLELAWGFD